MYSRGRGSIELGLSLCFPTWLTSVRQILIDLELREILKTVLVSPILATLQCGHGGQARQTRLTVGTVVNFSSKSSFVNSRR